MRFTLCLSFLAATIMAVFALEPASLFDYARLPSCAQKCKVLSVSEKNCLPPAAPVSNSATYVDCLCHSEYLRNLHVDGSELCHDSCAFEDYISIQNYYKILCATVRPVATMASPSVSVMVASTTLADTLATSTVVHELTTSVEASPLETTHVNPRGSGKWYVSYVFVKSRCVLLAVNAERFVGLLALSRDALLTDFRFHNNWKYFLIAAIVILFFVFLFVGLSYYYRYWQARTKNRDVESSQGHSRPIRLQLLPSSSSQTLGGSRTWPGHTLLPDEFPNPSSSRSPPRRDPNFAATLRAYQQEVQEADQIRAMRRQRLPPRAPGTSLESTEALVRARMLEYGRSDPPRRTPSKLRR